MPDPVWDHKFPVLLDQFPTYKDWPDVAQDTWNNATWQNVFTSLAAIQNYWINWFRDYVSWVSVTGFTTTIDGGASVTPNATLLYLATGAVLNNRAFLRSGNAFSQLNYAGRLLIYDFYTFDYGRITNVNSWFFLVNDGTAPPVETADHIGFKFVNADVFATNAGGGVQTITDTGVNMAVSVVQKHFRIVLDPGVNCRFYIDGALVVTHTTNLPTVHTFYHNLGIRTYAVAGCDVRVSRLLVEQAN